MINMAFNPLSFNLYRSHTRFFDEPALSATQLQINLLPIKKLSQERDPRLNKVASEGGRPRAGQQANSFGLWNIPGCALQIKNKLSDERHHNPTGAWAQKNTHKKYININATVFSRSDGTLLTSHKSLNSINRRTDRWDSWTSDRKSST